MGGPQCFSGPEMPAQRARMLFALLFALSLPLSHDKINNSIRLTGGRGNQKLVGSASCEKHIARLPCPQSPALVPQTARVVRCRGSMLP